MTPNRIIRRMAKEYIILLLLCVTMQECSYLWLCWRVRDSCMQFLHSHADMSVQPVRCRQKASQRYIEVMGCYLIGDLPSILHRRLSFLHLLAWVPWNWGNLTLKTNLAFLCKSGLGLSNSWSLVRKSCLFLWFYFEIYILPFFYAKGTPKRVCKIRWTAYKAKSPPMRIEIWKQQL